MATDHLAEYRALTTEEFDAAYNAWLKANPDVTDVEHSIDLFEADWFKGWRPKADEAKAPDHFHCKSIGCYNRIQFIKTCSRCNGATTPCRGEKDGCRR